MVDWLVLLGFTLNWGIHSTNQPPTNRPKTITNFQFNYYIFSKKITYFQF